jgi:hypothetical protein
MRGALSMVAALAAFASCERVEEPAPRPVPHSSAPHQQTLAGPTGKTPGVEASTSSAGAASAAPVERCVVKTSDTPAPRAHKATSCPKDPAGDYDLPHGSVRFVDAPKAPKIDVEVAAAEDHRERGLMYRTNMSDKRGMLFSWPYQSVRTFWMRNTCIPLDMLFIAHDGTIAGILEQVPTLNDEPRTIPCPASYVLEVNAGWTRAHGVKAGQKVVIDS